jgi:spermidine synthase
LNLGDISYYMLGNASEALAHWREVLRAQPNHVIVLNQAARLLATCPDDSIRNGKEAVAFAERAAKLSGGREPAILDALAAAYAESGRFEDAVATAESALAIAAGQNNQAVAETLKSRIELYKARTPLRRTQ